ncbi:hypothetical protein RIF29_41981 [Crotalaria pallida]|uniref:DUF538 family protein n=1 Tax=Crotalaria pallida TaxID=3830 RepID=A0AAN9E6H4_CROPI
MSPHIIIPITIITTTFFFFFFLSSASTSPSISTTKDIHDVISDYGFPKGILPNNAISYTIFSNTSSFSIDLQSQCYVHFDDHLVYYNTHITGKLSYGSVTDVSGIQVKSLFVWIPVTGIKVDRDDLGMVDFFVGPLTQKLPAKQFDKVPGCEPPKAKAKAGCDLFGSRKLEDRMWMDE